MSTIAHAAAVAFGLFFVGCHETREPSVDKLTTASAPSQVAAASTSTAPSSDIPASHGYPAAFGSTPSSGSSAPIEAPDVSPGRPNGQPKEQPKLQPVLSKPFPDGATDEQVCAAIANTAEKDLWVRFGHLVPLHITGSILVIQSMPSDLSRIEHVVGDYHNGVYWPSLKHCSKGAAMLYVRSLAEAPPDAPPRGPRHLAQLIEQKLGLQVSEFFGFRLDQERLSDYCRQDAELCERLVRLDYANQGTGLCNRALVECRVLSTDSEYGALIGKCSKLPRQQLACMEVIGDRQRRHECEARIRESLCPKN